MKFKYGDIRTVLASHRVFFGGQHLDKPLPFYTDHLIINVPEHISLEPYCTFWGRSGTHLVSMGAFSYSSSALPAIVSVGRYCSIAPGLQTLGDRHPHEWISTCPSLYSPHSGLIKMLEADTGRENAFHSFDKRHKKITIGNDVWIGQNVTLAQGISVGDGAVIAANSLVIKDVPPYSVVGGNPAKVIKDRFNDSIVDAMRSLKWWNYSLQDFSDLNVKDPYIFCHQFAERVISGKVKEYTPSVMTIKDIKAAAELRVESLTK